MIAGTGAFRFVPLTEADLPFFLEIRNECRNWLHDDRAFTLDQCRQWFHGARPEYWLIHHRNERIGYFRLGPWDDRDQSVFVGADLHASYRGRGLAKLAYEAFLTFLRDERGVALARLEVLSHNGPACRLYAGLGFVEVGRKRSFAVRDGCAVDSIVMTKPL